MKTVAALAYFVLLLGWAAAEEENFSVSQCKDSIFYDADDAEDDVIEECLKMPEIAAVAEGFTGTDDDKRDEIIYQCMSKQAGMLAAYIRCVKEYCEKK